MTIVRRYIAVSFMATFLVALLVITFVMSLGAVFRMSDLVARGAAIRPVLSLFVSIIPFMLTFALPLAALVSSLLVFGRLSADGEIMAMRACGISSRQIVVGPVLFATFLVALCLYINADIAPRSHFLQKIAPSILGLQSSVELIEEGRYIQDFEGLTLYIGKKKGQNLNDVRIWDFRQPNVKRHLRAATGTLAVDTNSTDLVLSLFDVRIDPFYDDRPGAGYCGQWRLSIGGIRIRKFTKREPDMTFRELMVQMLNLDQLPFDMSRQERLVRKMALTVEVNKRVALSFSCLAFVLVGVPLGIKSQRKESSANIGISFLMAFAFYLFIVTGEALAKRPALRPDLIILAPIVMALFLGPYLLRRMN